MTAPEYVQLKAFARVDGAILSVLWVVSFALYVVSLKSPLYATPSLLLALASPLFVGVRLRRFRDDPLDGVISFRRGWAYVVLVFFYAAIVFAVAQYGYFRFIDQGYLLSNIERLMSAQDMKATIDGMGLADDLSESLRLMRDMRPIDFALNVLTANIMAGIVVGLPIGALVQRKPLQTNN